MFKPVILGITGVLLLLSSGWTQDTGQQATATRNLTSMPLAFSENQGQWDERVLFRADIGDATMWFQRSGVDYQLRRQVPGIGNPGEIQIRTGGATFMRPSDRKPESSPPLVIKTTFVGANPTPSVIGDNLLDHRCNYFIGNDPTKWRTGVTNYGAIVYEDLYPGVDLKFYGNGNQMKYDFIVSPGEDYSQIRVRYEGANSLSIDAQGHLVVQTDGDALTEHKPTIYQVDGDRRLPVEGEYTLLSGNSFGFHISDDYDPSLPLVIDPILSYATYLRGSDWDFPADIALDDSGNVYVAGWTLSSDFPIGSPGQSGFVAKLNQAGDSLIWGTGIDGYVSGLALDEDGSVYVTGSDDISVFVSKLSGDGSGVLYTTHIGPGNGRMVTLDHSGNVYVTGWTDSPDFPTVNPYQAELAGYEDAFVVKLSSGGDSLVYSTYVGGSSFDWSYDIEVDAMGFAYIKGETCSDDFPTVNAFQPSFSGMFDVFVTKLDSSGSTLSYSTYFGGSDNELAQGFALDGNGNAYVTGQTFSADLPTMMPLQLFQGFCDGFAAKLNSTGSDLVYSTYLGGSGFDYGAGLAVDSQGNAFVVGGTFSLDFPLMGSFQRHKGVQDAYIVSLDATGSSLNYSTLLGGSLLDGCGRVALDDSGNAYVVGTTRSPDFPAEDPFQTNAGEDDGFVAKVSVCCVLRGDMDGSDGVHIGDLTFLTDYFFRSGTPPTCPEEGDVNGEGRMNVVDVTFLVLYLFGEGPPPEPCP